jgi:hypothetical protein
VPEKREVVAEQLRELADDLKQLLVAVKSDPKEQARKERRWRILYGALGAVATVFARRAAAKAWGVLTGELPPGRGQPQPVHDRDRTEVSTPVR